MKDGGVIRFRAVKARRVRQLQGIGGGGVAGALMPVEDRRTLRHGVDQLGTPLNGGKAVRERGYRWDRPPVDLRGVEDRILSQDETLFRLPRLGVLMGIDVPEYHGDAVCACADPPPGGGD